MSDTHENKDETNFLKKEFGEFGKLFELSAAFLLLYSLFAEVVNKVAVAFAGAERAALPTIISIRLPIHDAIIHLIVVCILVGIITYVVWRYVCTRTWMLEVVRIVRCWEIFVIWNPWTWIKVIVCVVVECLRWVAKLCCRWVPSVVVILVFLCIIVGLFIILG